MSSWDALPKLEPQSSIPVCACDAVGGHCANYASLLRLSHFCPLYLPGAYSCHFSFGLPLFPPLLSMNTPRPSPHGSTPFNWESLLSHSALTVPGSLSVGDDLPLAPPRLYRSERVYNMSTDTRELFSPRGQSIDRQVDQLTCICGSQRVTLCFLHKYFCSLPCLHLWVRPQIQYFPPGEVPPSPTLVGVELNPGPWCWKVTVSEFDMFHSELNVDVKNDAFAYVDALLTQFKTRTTPNYTITLKRTWFDSLPPSPPLVGVEPNPGPTRTARLIQRHPERTNFMTTARSGRQGTANVHVDPMSHTPLFETNPADPRTFQARRCLQCAKMHPTDHDFCGEACYNQWRSYMSSVVEGTDLIMNEYGVYVFKAPPHPKTGGTRWPRRRGFSSYIHEFEVKMRVYTDEDYPWPCASYFTLLL